MSTPYLTAHVKPAVPASYHHATAQPCPGPATAPAHCDAQPPAGHVRCDPCKTHNQEHT